MCVSGPTISTRTSTPPQEDILSVDGQIASPRLASLYPRSYIESSQPSGYESQTTPEDIAHLQLAGKDPATPVAVKEEQRSKEHVPPIDTSKIIRSNSLPIFHSISDFGQGQLTMKRTRSFPEQGAGADELCRQQDDADDDDDVQQGESHADADPDAESYVEVPQRNLGHTFAAVDAANKDSPGSTGGRLDACDTPRTVYMRSGIGSAAVPMYIDRKPLPVQNEEEGADAETEARLIMLLGSSSCQDEDEESIAGVTDLVSRLRDRWNIEQRRLVTSAEGTRMIVRAALL